MYFFMHWGGVSLKLYNIIHHIIARFKKGPVIALHLQLRLQQLRLFESCSPDASLLARQCPVRLDLTGLSLTHRRCSCIVQQRRWLRV